MLLVEDEPYMAEAIRDGLRLEAIAADIAGDGASALELLSVNAYDIAVSTVTFPDRQGTIGQTHRRRPAPAADLDAADRRRRRDRQGLRVRARSRMDYLTQPFNSPRSSCSVSERSTGRRAQPQAACAENRRSASGSVAREVYRDGRYVALTRKQFAVLEVLVAAEGGVVSAEELLKRAWDENADPFTNAVRITVSALRKRLGEPAVITTVAGAGYRIDTASGTRREGGDRG